MPLVLGASPERWITQAASALLLGLLLAACEAQATPVGRVTLTDEGVSAAVPTVTQTALPELRYGFLGGAEQFAPSGGLFANAEVIAPGADPAAYDIAVAYGTVPDWQQSPILQRVSLVLNTTLPPLVDADFSALLRTAISPPDLLEGLEIPGVLPGSSHSRDVRAVRVALANQGYPDGVTLAIAAEFIPGLGLVTEHLQESSIRAEVLSLAPEDAPDAYAQGLAHLLLIRWYEDAQRAEWVTLAGDENVVDLYALPISYRASGDLAIEFTAEGWPIPASR